MASRDCPVCCVRLVRNESGLAACIDCQRYFHKACLSASGPSNRCNRCALKDTDKKANTQAAANCLHPAQLAATPIQPSSSAASEPEPEATPTASDYSAKRRASTPSPSVTPVPKAHRPASSAAAEQALPAVMDDSETSNAIAGNVAPFPVLDPDGTMKASLHDAPHYVHVIYDLLKTSHDTNAAASAANAATLANVALSLAESTRVLSNLVPRMDAVEQRLHTIEGAQAALSARHDSDIGAVRSGLSYHSAAIQESLSHRALKDPRELLVRGIPPSINHEPMQLAASLLRALNLHLYVQLITEAREWKPPPRTRPPSALGAAAPPAPLPATPLRAFVFKLANPEARDDILLKTPALKDLSCQAIFGTGGAAKLSVTALWPDPIYKLLNYALSRYKQLGHLRPIVSNLTVFMRPSKTGPLIPVTCEADVDALASSPS